MKFRPTWQTSCPSNECRGKLGDIEVKCNTPSPQNHHHKQVEIAPDSREMSKHRKRNSMHSILVVCESQLYPQKLDNSTPETNWEHNITF